MKIISLCSLLLCIQISASYTETMTLKTFFSNLWTGNSTFIAEKLVPVINRDGQQFIIVGSGKFKDAAMPCQINKNDMFDTSSFFKIWAQNLKQELEKEEEKRGTTINEFPVKKFSINKENGEIAKNQNGTIDVFEKELVVNKESKPLKCTICYKKSFSKQEVTCLTCCETSDHAKIVCKNCVAHIKEQLSGKCSFCQRPLFNVDQSLGRFNIFLNHKLAKIYNKSLNINDIPLYVLNKSDETIGKIENKYFPTKMISEPDGNCVPITTFLKRGAPLQIKSTGESFDVPRNLERTSLLVETLALSGTFITILALSKLFPEYYCSPTKEPASFIEAYAAQRLVVEAAVHALWNTYICGKTGIYSFLLAKKLIPHN